MAVGEFARRVLDSGLDLGLPLREGTSLPWLSGFGHASPAVAKAPQRLLGRLAKIHAALGGDPELLVSKRAAAPKVDLFLGEQVVVEVDEVQHFSSARLNSLTAYEGLKVGFDLATYQYLCSIYREKADAYRRKKQAADFPFPGGRTAQRAYLDSVRDILGPVFGFTVVRVPAPNLNLAEATEALRKAARELGF
jgi:hypothetical protein